MAGINIPVGISDFEKIRRNGYYYVDKTGLIPELLKGEAAEVTLITRPRRFGKTLGMSMLASFFDIRKDSRDMFSGFSVMRDEKLCRTWMNQRPVLFLSLRKVDGLNFTAAAGAQIIDPACSKANQQTHRQNETFQNHECPSAAASSSVFMVMVVMMCSRS